MIYDTPHLIYWDWRIAADLFFGGIGVGAFLIAVLNSLVYKDKYPSVSKVGAVLAPIMVILGLILMVTELGHPMRMWRTITGFNVSSPLSWGGPFQALMVVIGIAYAALWLRPGSAKTRNLVGIIGIPIALVVGAYHGWLLTIVKARPLWNTGPATISALLGFVTTGMAAVLLVLCIQHRNGRTAAEAPTEEGGEASAPWMIRDFRRLLVGAMIIQALTFFIWWISLEYGSADAQGALVAANVATGPLFWFVGIGLGLVVPIILQVQAIIVSKRLESLSMPLTILTAVLILIGGFVFRYAVVIGGQLY